MIHMASTRPVQQCFRPAITYVVTGHSQNLLSSRGWLDPNLAKTQPPAGKRQKTTQPAPLPTGRRRAGCRSALSVAEGDVQWEVLRLAPLGDTKEVQADKQWLAGHITLWLDEEWTPLDVHKALGEATAEAYVRIRQSGEDELSSVLLQLGSDLQGFDFHDTFTDAFEVANKVTELLMMRMGREVCCQSEDDKSRYQRLKWELVE